MQRRPARLVDLGLALDESLDQRQLALERSQHQRALASRVAHLDSHQRLVEQEIGELVWDKEEQVNYASTPMFMIFAEK